MKNLLSLLFLIAIISVGHSQSLWKTYKPTQSNLVGWTVNYQNSTTYMTRSQNRLDSMTTTESSESYDHYSKSTNIEVIGVSRNIGKITTIQPMGNVYIDQAYILKAPVVPGAVYVQSAARADSCRITFVKNASLNVKPMELINGICKTFGIETDWLKINWVDTIKHTYKDSISAIIKKPNVYFLISLAKLKKPGVSMPLIPFAERKLHPEYYKTFNGKNANDQKPVTLDPTSNTNGIVSCTTEGVSPTCEVTLFVDKDENNVTQLYAISNYDNYGRILIKPNIGKQWKLVDLPIGLFNTSNNIYVEIKIDVVAYREGDKIILKESYMTYPKYVMTSQ